MTQIQVYQMRLHCL